MAEHGRGAGNTGSFGIILDHPALDPHPGPDLSQLGGQIPLEPRQQAGGRVNPRHLIPAPSQPQGLCPLTTSKINYPNGRRRQLHAKLAREEFLAHYVPELSQPGLPALFAGGERGAHLAWPSSRCIRTVSIHRPCLRPTLASRPTSAKPNRR